MKRSEVGPHLNVFWISKLHRASNEEGVNSKGQNHTIFKCRWISLKIFKNNGKLHHASICITGGRDFMTPMNMALEGNAK